MDPDVRLLLGAPLAERVKEDAAARAARLRTHGIVPTLALVAVGDDPASAVYLARKTAAGEAAGIAVRAKRLEADAEHAAGFAMLAELAQDPAVHGVLLQMPLPDGWPAKELQLAIPPAKDVDGFHPENLGRLALGLPGFVACTPLGIQALLAYYKVDVAGRRVVVVGRSAIVGTPLALLLSRKGVDATVTLAHSRTPDLPSVCREADVLVAALGVPRAIGAAHVKKGAVVVDVGIHREPNPAVPGKTRLVGDVDQDAVRGIASAISPVPGGVGPLTVAFLMHNTIGAAEQAARAHGVLPA
jgi:methylenetetrahydrofolate dehydrogenase (NADP+)/methenyltetrahydrofolate cyclohydrolase